MQATRWGVRLALGLVALMLHQAVTAGNATSASPPLAVQPNADLFGGGFPTALIELDDGSLIVGGGFRRVGGREVQNLVRLLGDGSVDSEWALGADGTVDALERGPDGMIYAIGRFSRLGNQDRSGLARFSASGQIDMAWVPVAPPGANHDTSAIAFDAQGGAYVAYNGSFSGSFGRIIRLSLATGAADDFAIDANSIVFSLAWDSVRNDLLAAGSFRTIGGQARNGFARVDLDAGAVDDWNPTAADSSSPRGERVLLDGSHAILVGQFNTIAGVATRSLARVSLLDGSADPGWTYTMSSGARVTTARRLADGSLVFAGTFSSVNDQARPTGIARVAANGELLSWTPAADSLPTSSDDIGVAKDGRIIIPRYPGGQSSSRLLWLDPLTAQAMPPSSDVEFDDVAFPFAFVPAGQGGLWFTGNVLEAGGQRGFGANRLVADLSLEGFAGGLHQGTIDSSSPRALAVVGDGLYLGGFFFGSNPSRGIARISALDGSETAEWTLSAGVSFVQSLLADADAGQIYFSGSFTASTPSGNVRNLARADAASGQIDPNWRPLASFSSRGRMALSDGFLYFGGGQTINRFLTADATMDSNWSVPVASSVVLIDRDTRWLYASNLRRYAVFDGAIDPDWDPLGGRGGNATELVFAADGSLHALGAFSVACDGSSVSLLRILANTDRIDPTWRPSVVGGTPSSLTVAENGIVVVGGNFTQVQGQRRVGMAGLGASSTVFVDGFDETAGCVR